MKTIIPFLFLSLVLAVSCSRVVVPEAQAAEGEGEAEDCDEGKVLIDGECVCVAGEACTSNPPSEGEGEPAEGEGEGPAGCVLDSDCDTNQVCDDFGDCRDIDAPPGECVRDDECGTGEVCNDDGECLDADAPPPPTPECDEDADCASNEVCDDDGDCIEVEPPPPTGCVRDDECGANRVCNDDGECLDANPPPTPACDEDADCGANQVCNDAGDCVGANPPPAGEDEVCFVFRVPVDIDLAGMFSTGDEALPADQDNVTQVCGTLAIGVDGLVHGNARVNGSNLRFLAKNVENQRCDFDADFLRAKVNGVTVATVALPVQCNSNPTACTGSQRIPTAGCDLWIGVEPTAPECNDDGDCAGTDVCNDAGDCVAVTPPPPSGCQDDTDCASNAVCDDQGDCIVVSPPPSGCTFDSECGTDERCNDAGNCVDATPAEPCVLDSECGLDQACNDAGSCVAVTVSGPPPTGQAIAIIDNAAGNPTVLEIRNDQMSLCNASTGCSSPEGSGVFRDGKVHAVGFDDRINNILFYTEEQRQELGFEDEVVDPANDVLNLFDGEVWRFNVPNYFTCRQPDSSEFLFIALVAEKKKDGVGFPNPSFEYRDTEWRLADFPNVPSTFRQTNYLGTGITVLELEVFCGANRQVIRIEPGSD